MAAASNPLNTAGSVVSYSTNSGSSYTPFGSEVLDFAPDGRERKVLERRLKGATRVQKIVARIDNKNTMVTLEYSSATYTLVAGWFDNKTPIWLRDEMDDTGGTNGSRHVYKGYVSAVGNPHTPGDDAVEQFTFTLANDDFAFTAGA